MSDLPEDKKSQLRTIVAEVDAAMTDASSTAARDAWQRLVVALDLGPAPATRSCPHCGRLGMAQASRCGFCWKPTP